ncbi:hypothetical protein N7499_003548 [Penicillium canescens]|uniref:Uncharacterized protein n=1 Tax=Penicillium canescens TaxID=5083 RepID=A0AAD6I9W3_PENCN|nr:uncharacterized protein N7446_012473 [Penicillium canescens]KAJ6020257.1 hypothetical protein N7522_000332 [Penicillium canescens]KAJ6038666.1 hypothetical protein N7460_007383 [Penicillium canescens]KAJ6045609.1 hypothetical protein N7446_012473 [Penicillium canescens]KAJ6059947.1 hypothetical protein N7444_002879 [Penicillium canescens]KAJ6090834.1 hypothetical protein N7499_003548 [Penicillium canescens]
MANELVHGGDLLQKLSSLNRQRELPSDFKESIVEASLFQKPLGSHDALHTFQDMCKDNLHSLVAEAIDGAFRDPALRKSIETNWGLSYDFDHAKSQQDIIDKSAPYDLASWSIINCPTECFPYLLSRGAISPSAYSRTGESFFCLAVKSDHELESIDLLLSAMGNEHIFQPYMLSEPEDDRKTILQASIYNEPLFRACWKRVKSQPHPPQYSLGPQELGHICRFVDVELAEDLLQCEVDIAKPHQENPSPGWLELLCQSDASQMFDWFLGRGSAPPKWYLTYAAEHDCVHAVQWILGHTDDYDDWLRSSLVAAKRKEEKSADMLATILRSPLSKWKPNDRLRQDIAITIVDSMCDESEALYITLEDIYPENTSPASCEMIARREDIAIRKLHTLRDVGGGVSIVGLKVKSTAAGLYGLTEALGDLEP